MNDDFIYRTLPEVPKEFAESLYKNISSDMPSRSKRGVYARLKGLRRSQVALIALGVLLLIAWSQLRLWVRYVPVGDLWLVEFAKTTQVGEPAVPFVPTPLPTHDWNNPDEPSLDSPFYETSLRLWSNTAGEKIRLYFEGKAGGMHPYAPQGMWEEVSVNGQPAILIHGRLATTSAENPQTPRKWDKKLGLQLYWSTGKLIHVLETYGSYVSEQDLIRMAESAQEFRPWQLTPTP